MSHIASVTLPVRARVRHWLAQAFIRLFVFLPLWLTAWIVMAFGYVFHNVAQRRIVLEYMMDPIYDGVSRSPAGQMLIGIAGAAVVTLLPPVNQAVIMVGLTVLLVCQLSRVYPACDVFTRFVYRCGLAAAAYLWLCDDAIDHVVDYIKSRFLRRLATADVSSSAQA